MTGVRDRRVCVSHGRPRVAGHGGRYRLFTALLTTQHGSTAGGQKECCPWTAYVLLIDSYTIHRHGIRRCVIVSEPIRVLIADDHPIVREGLSTLLSTQDDMVLVGETSTGKETIRRALTVKPDVLLLDLVLPDKNGEEIVKELVEHDLDTRILVLTSFSSDDQVVGALKAGALGYMLKDSSSETLLDAIRTVYRGEPALHSSIALKVVRDLRQPTQETSDEDSLTSREVDVLKLVAQGLSNEEIAEELVISDRTVGAHVSSILQKLRLANRTQATLYALRQGLVDLYPTD